MSKVPSLYLGRSLSLSCLLSMHLSPFFFFSPLELKACSFISSAAVEYYKNRKEVTGKTVSVSTLFVLNLCNFPHPFNLDLVLNYICF